MVCRTITQKGSFVKISFIFDKKIMAGIDDFFSLRNTVNEVSNKNKKITKNYLEPIKAFARTTYKSIYVIDYNKKGFDYVSDNPLFLCGNTAAEVKEMGYNFYFKHVIEADLELLLKINTIGFDFYETVPLEEILDYTISYDFHLKDLNKKTFLINQKLTPLYLTEEGKLWKAMCVISLSSEQKSGNVKVYKKDTEKVIEYDLEKNYWKEVDKINLSEREIEILHYSIKGYTVKEISEHIFVSPETVKFHRKKLFVKLNVNNISEAIAYVIGNNLI